MLALEQNWTAFSHEDTVDAIKSLWLFDEVFSYDEITAKPFVLIIDLTSYDYSYALSEKLCWSSIVRRQIEHPWRIEYRQVGDIDIHDCPALSPSTGWFAKDPLASAMLCELPVLNIGLGYASTDRRIYENALCFGKLNSSIGSRGSTYEVLILPNGAHPAKHYPLDSWEKICNELRSWGFRVVFVIGPQESLTLVPILGKLGLPWILPNNLSELCAAILSSRLVLSNDCGPMHVALMLGKPTLAIFGPTIPESWFCPTSEGQHYLQSDRSISNRSDILKGDSWVDWPSSDETIHRVINFFNCTSSVGLVTDQISTDRSIS